MLHIGSDLHTKTTMFTIKNDSGEIITQENLDNDKRVLKSFISQFPDSKRVAVEATGNWYWFVDLMEQLADEVCLINPTKAKAIAQARVKTDKLDSKMLAELSRLDLLPTVYIPPKEVRNKRELLRYRIYLVRLRTNLKNRVHSIIHKNGIRHEFSNIFSDKGITFIQKLNLNQVYKLIIENSIEIITFINSQITEVEESLYKDLPRKNSDIELIDTLPGYTLPGFGIFNSTLAAYEIGTIDRFIGHKNLVSYAGLSPSTSQSADVVRHGRLMPHSNLWLKWVYIEAAQTAKNHAWFNPLYQRTMKKHGKGVAKIAVARELAIITYYMLKGREPFRGQANNSSRRGSIS